MLRWRPALGLAVLCAGGAALAAGGGWVTVVPLDATATSYLHSAWNPHDENYHPRYALDGDPATAWLEGASGDGVGERLELKLPTLTGASALELRVRTGYARSGELHKANGAPTTLRIVLLDAAGRAASTREVSLQDSADWQRVALTPPSQLATVSIEVVGARPGRSYRDTAISDVELRAKGGSFDAAAATAAARERSAWIAARKAEAGKPAPPGPLQGASFTRVSYEEPTGNPLPEQLARLNALFSKVNAEGVVQRVESVRPAAPTPKVEGDELRDLGAVLSEIDELLRVSDLHIAEAPAELRPVTSAGLGYRDIPNIVVETNPRVLRASDGQLQSLAWRTWTENNYRGRFSAPMADYLATELLLQYENGLATAALTRWSMHSGYEEAGTRLALLRYDDQGRVREVELVVWRSDTTPGWLHARFQRTEG